MGLLYIINESTFKTEYGKDLIKRLNPIVIMTTNYMTNRDRIETYLEKPRILSLLLSKSTYKNTNLMLDSLYKITDLYNTKTVLTRNMVAVIDDIHFEEDYITKELLKPKLIDNGKFRSVVFKLKPIFNKGQ